MTHTPGPWHVYGLDVWSERQMVSASPSGTITELESNARLIAAAPELLEFAESQICHIHELRPAGECSYSLRCDEAQRLIAKAKGDAP